MSTTVPLHRPGMVRLRELPAEEQIKQAQQDATNALIKLKRQDEHIEKLEQNLQALANFVRDLADQIKRLT